MKAPSGLRCASLVLSILTIDTSDLQAAIIPISQSRSVSIFGELLIDDPPMIVDSFSDSRTAPDFGPFSERINDAFCCDNFSRVLFAAGAAQTSVIGPLSVQVSGDAGTAGDISNLPGLGQGEAHSDFDLVFDLDKTGQWRFNVSWFGSGSGETSVVLSRDGVPIFSDFPRGRFHEELVELTAGTYRLQVSAMGAGVGAGKMLEVNSARYSVEFASTAIPEPGPSILIGTSIAAFILARRVLTG